MYCKMSDASRMALNMNKNLARRIGKKWDIASAEEVFRTFGAMSTDQAAIEITRSQNPELAERMDEYMHSRRYAESIKTLKGIASLSMTSEASKYLKWMRSHGYYGNTVADAYNVLWEFEPVLSEKLKLAFIVDDFVQDNGTVVLKRMHWVQAIKMALIQYNWKISMALQGPERKISREFSIFYAQVLCQLFHIVRFDRGIVQPVKAKHTTNDEVYLQRIESLSSQLDRVREENDRLRNKDRREVDSLVVPLEQELRKRDERIAELEEENATLREIQDQFTQQNDYAEELLELPTSGVMFVGGSPQLRQKVSSMFPEWRVVGSEDKGRVTPGNDLLFLFTDYISHSTYYVARKKAGQKPLYCHGRNWELLENSMRTAYTIAFKNGDIVRDAKAT